jgi:transposase
MAKTPPEISVRKCTIEAVHAGTSITEAARNAGVTRATLYHWLKAFDPDRPRASLQPQPRGPKSPRWGDEVVDAVINVIRHDPELWGCRRVAVALAERGIIVPERTVSRILLVARERIATERDREQRKRQARNSRRVAALARRDELDARREVEVRQWLEENITPGMLLEEAMERICAALSDTAWKFKTNLLTPTLCQLADSCIKAARDNPAVPQWLRESYRWGDQDHARVAALNYLVKLFRRGEIKQILPLFASSVIAMLPSAP